jgi:hypothetical protein
MLVELSFPKSRNSGGRTRMLAQFSYFDHPQSSDWAKPSFVLLVGGSGISAEQGLGGHHPLSILVTLMYSNYHPLDACFHFRAVVLRQHSTTDVSCGTEMARWPSILTKVPAVTKVARYALLAESWTGSLEFLTFSIPVCCRLLGRRRQQRISRSLHQCTRVVTSTLKRD